MPPLNIAKPIARGGFPNILIEAFYLGSIKGLSLALDDINFDAPINGIINWPGLWMR
jgi:hypothetical protein